MVAIGLEKLVLVERIACESRQILPISVGNGLLLVI
jgi:hypothetical protein